MTLHFMRFKLGEFNFQTATVISKTVRDVPVQPSSISPV
jgi:hypothetical protein